MAMGYLDTCTSLVLSNSRLGIYSIRGQGYREYGDHLHCGGALECFIVVVAMVLSLILVGSYTIV